MLIAVDAQAHTVHHHCEICHTHREAVPLTEVWVSEHDMVIGPCPTCLARDVTTTEHFPCTHTAIDAGEIQHPDSLVGARFPNGGVVTEDTRYGGSPQRQAHVRLIRAMQAALGLPLAK
jgi:hypothetical protein